MIRFFTRFLKSYGIIRRFINLRQVRLSQGLRNAVPARNLLLRFGQWGWVRQVLGLFIKSNILLILVSAIGCLSVSLIRFWLSSKGYGSYFEYIIFKGLATTISIGLVLWDFTNFLWFPLRGP